MSYYESMFGGGNYSTSEIKTGAYWIDGKPIYRKVIDFGNLPNNTSKSVPHGINNLSYVVSLRAMCVDSNNNYQPVPYIALDPTYSKSLYCNPTSVIVATAYNYGSMKATVIIEYTKTTD